MPDPVSASRRDERPYCDEPIASREADSPRARESDDARRDDDATQAVYATLPASDHTGLVSRAPQLASSASASNTNASMPIAPEPASQPPTATPAEPYAWQADARWYERLGAWAGDTVHQVSGRNELAALEKSETLAKVVTVGALAIATDGIAADFGASVLGLSAVQAGVFGATAGVTAAHAAQAALTGETPTVTQIVIDHTLALAVFGLAPRAPISAAPVARSTAKEAVTLEAVAANPKGALQALTTEVSERLAANPELAKTVLSDAEYTAATKSPAVARMQFGNAVERLVAKEIEASSVHGEIFKHVGGPGKPDFIGLGAAKGMNFDITTPLQVERHLARPLYGDGLNVVTYHRPPAIKVFP